MKKIGNLPPSVKTVYGILKNTYLKVTNNKLRVNICSGFIDDQNAGVSEYGAGETDQLPLADAQIRPALRHRPIQHAATNTAIHVFRSKGSGNENRFAEDSCNK